MKDKIINNGDAGDGLISQKYRHIKQCLKNKDWILIRREHLVLKGIIVPGVSLITMRQSATLYLQRKNK